MKQIIDYFDHAFLINLPERTDRRRRAEHEFRKLGFEIEAAIPGQSPRCKISLFPAIKFDDAGSFPSAGYRGSVASHHQVLKLARERHLKNVLIFEDDIHFNPVEPSIVQRIVDQVPTEWDIIYFGYLTPTRPSSSEAGLLRHSAGTIGGHFYAVNGSFFDVMITYMKDSQSRPAGHPDGGSMGRDGTYSHLLLVRPQTRVFIASPNLAKQHGTKSDISPRLLDKTFLAPLVEFFRVTRNRFLD
ncbi:glycosyltransferase family 25 protein [Bradyrhizobium sp. AZCC 1693]|uniref:glycosyltransferase family 25 protein n=1 Tax=Bradyrhizobium sp. AZCC 1693 TaxID=3117029 RepID=UPI002FEFF81B